MIMQQALMSPRIARLYSAFKHGDHTALDRFWQEINEHGGPLIEPIEGDETQTLVSFLWRDQGNTRTIIVVGGPACTGEFAEHQLQRFLATDLWYKTYQVPADLRTTYQLLLNSSLRPCRDVEDLLLRMAEAQADPLNPRQMNLPLGLPSGHQFRQASVLELPRAPVQPWTVSQPDVPQGKIKMSMLNSSILQNKYSVAVYTPPGYTDVGNSYNVLMLFDGWMYINYMALPTLMDNILHAAQILPYVVVLLSHLDYGIRRRELLCHRPFLDFLVQELMPWAHERYHLTHDPARTIIGGVSAGGVAAAFAGLTAPEIFGNVLSQSGTFWSSGGIDRGRDAEWLTGEFARHPRCALRFSLEMGLFDRYPLIDPVAANRRFYETLLSKGYEVSYDEFNGGHDFMCWKTSFADRFLYLGK